MGHLMRCVAVAEEAVSRGWSATLHGELAPEAVDLVQRLLPDVETVSGRPVSGDVIHLDTYADVTASPGPWLVSNMQDGAFGVRAADLAIDANLGAEPRFVGAEAAHALVGVSAVPVRSGVRAHRETPGKLTSGSGSTDRVLVVIGGTDPFGLTSRVVAGLAAVAKPLDVTVVTPAAQWAAVEKAAASSRHRIEPVPFLADLPSVAVAHDLVISASGTSVWDFACMGVPMALICVTDNQVAGYRAVLDAELAVGLGEPPHDGLLERLGALETVLHAPLVLDQLRDRGRTLVDGLGAWRIVSAWEQLLAVSMEPEVVRPLVARPATLLDADLLFEWRNDVGTRSGSRSPHEVSRDDHVAWLSRAVDSGERQLLVVEDEGCPVGTVRWDHLRGTDWEVSITVAPEARRRGLGVPLLRAGEVALGGAIGGAARLVATVHQDNAASRRLFERAGYLPLTPPNADGFATSARWRPARERPKSAASRG